MLDRSKIERSILHLSVFKLSSIDPSQIDQRPEIHLSISIDLSWIKIENLSYIYLSRKLSLIDISYIILDLSINHRSNIDPSVFIDQP